jgi:hypothetical protein
MGHMVAFQCLGCLAVSLAPHWGIHHDAACQHAEFSDVRGFPAPPEASHQGGLDGCVVRSVRRLVWQSVRGALPTRKVWEHLVSFGGRVSGAWSSISQLLRLHGFPPRIHHESDR